MGFKREREIQLKKQRKVKVIAFIAVAVLLVICTVVSVFVNMDEWKTRVALPKTGVRGTDELRMHFIDVGQGDATVIEFPDGKTALIDGGDDTESHKMQVLRYLNALEIDVIDYLIVTHADADHCGGLDAVLKHKRVVRAFVPKTPVSAGVQYQEFFQALEKEDCEITALRRCRIDDGSGGYTFSLLCPATEDEQGDDDNDISAVVWLEYQGVGTICMGDAPSSVETTLVSQAKNGLLESFAPNLHSTEIIKISHHGASTATDGDFLEYIHAQTAIISCGKDNVYGHPAEETLQTLQDKAITAYRTDTQGHIMITVSATGYTARTL